jgi:glucosamine 6-phosphate synthetase-like amidotransferase/phosphosugar isomerase protein
LLLATGSSLNAALCARYFFEQRFGVLVDIKEPYNFTHYEAIDPHTDLVVAISQSGKSASTLEAMRKVQASGSRFCPDLRPAKPDSPRLRWRSGYQYRDRERRVCHPRL